MIDIEPLAAETHERQMDAELHRPSMASRELCVNCQRGDIAVWPAVAVRIDLNMTPDGKATLEIDGKQAAVRPVSWLDGIPRPSPLVGLSRPRQYDVELWVGGELVGYVPGPDPEVDAAYEDAERRIA
jgi:hypothetical protein